MHQNQNGDLRALETDANPIARAFADARVFLDDLARTSEIATSLLVRESASSGSLEAIGRRYVGTYASWLRLCEQLTPEVCSAVRLGFPRNGIGVRLGSFGPAPTAIELLAVEIGQEYRDLVFRDRPHPQGPDCDPTSLVKEAWESLSEDAARSAAILLACNWGDFAELRNQLVMEAEVVLAAVATSGDRSSTTDPRPATSAASSDSGAASSPEDTCNETPLTENDILVLRTMSIFDPQHLVSVATILSEMPMSDALAPETVRTCVLKLIACELAARPEGERRGARLTLAGRRVAAKHAD